LGMWLTEQQQQRVSQWLADNATPPA